MKEDISNTHNLECSHPAHVIFFYINKKKSNPVENWARDLNRHFTKEAIHIINKLMKRCSNLSVIKDMQIKTYKLKP